MNTKSFFSPIIFLITLHLCFLKISSSDLESSSNFYRASSSSDDVFLSRSTFFDYCRKLQETSSYRLIMTDKKSYIKATGTIIAGITAQQIASQYVQVTKSSSKSLISSFLVGGCVSAAIMYLWVNKELETISSYKKSMDHFGNQLTNLKENINEIKKINKPLLERIADAEKMINEIDSVVANLTDKTYTSIQKQEEIIQEMRVTRIYIQKELQPILETIEQDPKTSDVIKKTSRSLIQKLLGPKPSPSSHEKRISCI